MRKNQFRGVGSKKIGCFVDEKGQEHQRLRKEEEEMVGKEEVEGGAVVVINDADELHAFLSHSL
eukprot:6260266-Ditylum_brightwellii.AAC.1